MRNILRTLLLALLATLLLCSAAMADELTGKTAIPEFQRWLEKMGFVENGHLTKKAGDGSSLLF